MLRDPDRRSSAGAPGPPAPVDPLVCLHGYLRVVCLLDNVSHRVGFYRVLGVLCRLHDRLVERDFDRAWADVDP